MRNNKGLSTVVTTLIIILLVLVAVGIIWGVVSNLLNNSRDRINTSTSCLEIEIKATKVVNTTTGGEQTITLSRTGAGDSGAMLAKLIVYSDANNSAVTNFDEVGFTPLQTKTATFDTGVDNANKVEVTPFYYNEQGEEVLCPTTTTYTFAALPDVA
ncbi:MAG: hypothetical protein KC516_01405 [Nanoarchaeota archaeon]|nr:hypothetical protein [Nanoarchaeota archaeon]